jgi:hypothetical protein
MKTEVSHCVALLGMTSLTADQATPEHLATSVRSRWAIENKIHWVEQDVLGRLRPRPHRIRPASHGLDPAPGHQSRPHRGLDHPVHAVKRRLTMIRYQSCLVDGYLTQTDLIMDAV